MSGSVADCDWLHEHMAYYWLELSVSGSSVAGEERDCQPRTLCCPPATARTRGQYIGQCNTYIYSYYNSNRLNRLFKIRDYNLEKFTVFIVYKSC